MMILKSSIYAQNEIYENRLNKLFRKKKYEYY